MGEGGSCFCVGERRETGTGSGRKFCTDFLKIIARKKLIFSYTTQPYRI